MSSTKPLSLYHYCSLNTFKNILENRSIWLSDILKSNDCDEIKWLNKRYEIVLGKTYTKLKKVFDLNIDDLYQFMHINDLFIQSPPIKSWCFCLSENGDVLSQWRGYADDGYGISIGFRFDCLENFSNELKLKQLPFLIDFKKIVYGEESADDFLFDQFDVHNLRLFNSKEDLIAHLQEGALIVALESCFFKNSSFMEENEWRLAISTITDNSKPENYKKTFLNHISTDMFRFKDFAYVSRRDDLISHIEIQLPNISRIVSEIIIGPKSNLSVHDMQSLLLSLDVFDEESLKSLKITKSKATYQ